MTMIMYMTIIQSLFIIFIATRPRSKCRLLGSSFRFFQNEAAALSKRSYRLDGIITHLKITNISMYKDMKLVGTNYTNFSQQRPKTVVLFT